MSRPTIHVACVLLLLAALSHAVPAGAVAINWVPVGSPGNAPDTAANCYAAQCGSVAYPYFISRYEVTNAQYAEFLNAKAALDAFLLYDPRMGSVSLSGGIGRSGASGSYSYAVIPGYENKPVVWVDFYDALRFANWLNNGQGSATTENGAYPLYGYTAVPVNGLTVTRNPLAGVFLPSENEWYKAAYFDPIAGVYYDYPAGSDAKMACTDPTDLPNHGNCIHGGARFLTDVGAYTGSPSPNGTFDQGGNVWEWNEEIVLGSYRGFRGGSNQDSVHESADQRGWNGPTSAGGSSGFRVAMIPGTVPEPTTGLLVLAGLCGLCTRRRAGARLAA